MRVAFDTLGCKVNQYETSAMMEYFTAEGAVVVDSGEEADAYILNSCTVTGESDKKTRQLLRRFRRKNPGAVICLCGCMPQAFPERAEKLPEADVVLGTRDRAAVFAAVKRRLIRGERVINIMPHEVGERFEPLSVRSFSARTRAFVKIEDGCERYCAYCVIPRARGPVRSKPLAALGAELRGLAAAGYREVVLVGINLSSYGADLGLCLTDAVTLACREPGIRRVRLGSLEPELLSSDDITAMSRLEKLCPQFHLSLQSGCDATLRRMRRPYSAADYRRIAGSLRASFPDAAITTDIMVGFPGETGEEFAESLTFVRETGFARAHVFAYSRRDGTPAAAMPDQVPNREKLVRSRTMIAAAHESSRAFLESRLGGTASVLFETRRPDGRWEGYSENYTPVLAASLEELSGEIRPVTLIAVEGEACVGVVVKTMEELEEMAK